MEPGDSNSWERLVEAAQQGEEQAEHLIFAVLAEALVRRGYGAIAADQPQDDGDKTVGVATKSFGFFVVWGLGISLASFLGLSHLLWPLGIVAVMSGSCFWQERRENLRLSSY